MDGNRRQDSDTALMSQMMSILSQLTLDVTQMKSDIHQQDLEMSSYVEQIRSSDPTLMQSGHYYHTEVTDSSLTTSPLLTSQDSTIFGSSSLLTETNTRNQENSEQLDGIENQEENVEEQQTDFQSMIEKLKTENESLICENILLKADHKLLGVKHTILSSKFKSLNNTNESLKFENEALISKNSQLERENEEHTCINESQKCVNEGLTSEILKLQNANKNLKLETDALNNQNNACTSANKTLTDGKIHAEAEIENLRATINQLEDKIRAVDTENEVLKKDKQQLSNQKAKLIEQANSRIKEILKEKEEIQGKADELKNKYKELESTVNSLEMKASRADTGREESRYETEQLRSELVRLKGDSTLSDCFSPLYEQRCKIIEQSIKGLVGKQFDNPDLKPLSRYTLTLYDRDKMFERYPNLKLISDVYYDIYDKMKDYLQELILDGFDPRLNNSYKYHREDLNHRKTFNIFFPCDNVKQTLECLIVMQNNLLRTQLVYDEWNEMANFPLEPLYEEGIYSVKSLTDLDPWVCHIMSYFISNVVSVFLDHHQF